MIVLLLIVSACRTREERARRLIEKADKLYPIKTLVDTLVRIDTLLKIDTVIIIKSDTVQITIPIKNEKGETIIYKNKTLKETEKYKVIGNTLYNGDLDLTVQIKEQKYSFTLWKSFKHEVIAKKELIRITKVIKTKGFFWWTGLITCFILGGGIITFIILSIRRIKPI